MINKKLKITLSIATCVLSLGLIVPNAYAWDSKESATEMDTHKLISVQALKMIENDMNTDNKIMNNLKIINSNITALKKGSIAPDWGDVGTDRDYKLYQDHFFDPDTEKNFTANKAYPLYEVPDNAESQLRNYFSRAVSTWKDGNYSESMYLLGKSLHYLEDLNQPHHALNWTGGPGTAHTNFEKYAEGIKDEFKISTMGEDKSEYKYMIDKPFIDFLTAQCFKYGKKSKSLQPLVSMQNSYEDWHKAASTGVKNAQKATASVIYRFLHEVTYPKTFDANTSIGKFHAIIKMSNDKYSGTDDHMYLGLKLKNGQTMEFKCDLPGNDFEAGKTGCYQFVVTDSNVKISDVAAVYVKKVKYGAGDDAKIDTVEVYMQGQRIVKKSANKWLKGNETYNIDLNKQ